MYNRLTKVALILLLLSLAFVNAEAQDVSEGAFVVEKNTKALNLMRNAVQLDERAVNKSAQFANHGPLPYRIATLQGVALQFLGRGIVIPPIGDESTARIIGGGPAQPDEFPWQVALLHSAYGTLIYA